MIYAKCLKFNHTIIADRIFKKNRLDLYRVNYTDSVFAFAMSLQAAKKINK